MPGTPSRRDRSLEALLDRVEDRLMDAPLGLHHTGDPAEAEALARAELPEEAAALWRRWDGIELAGGGEARLLSLAEQDRATAEAAAILRLGDRVIGEYGLALLVIPADPWEEGGEVVMVEDDGERAPYASSVARLALGLVAEMSVLYDDEGEYREGLFGDDGRLTARAERRLLRRRLDFDEDAPFPRFRLGQLLRRAGELRAARAELRRVLRCAPEFAWAHWELGRVGLELAEQLDQDSSRDPSQVRAAADAREEASRSFMSAADKAGDPRLQALFLAWQARIVAGVDEAEREAIAARVRQLDPGFVAAREAGLREAIEDEDGGRARELLALGLAVEPRHLGLLGLRERVAGLPDLDELELEPEPIVEVEEALDLAEPSPPKGEGSEAPRAEGSRAGKSGKSAGASRRDAGPSKRGRKRKRKR